jgi:hypothetical protein
MEARGGFGPEHPAAARPIRTPPAKNEGGRMARGLAALGEAWDFLRERPRLMVIPLLSAASIAVAALLIFAPILLLTGDLPFKVSIFIATAATALPFTFAGTFFNVAFLCMANDHMNGRDPSLREGFACARGRLRQIAAWSVLATFVGLILSALQNLPFDGSELFARIAGWIGGIAWSLATFFVVPVLVLEGTGARQTVRRSARVFRERWGESLTGDVAIGVVFACVFIPSCMCGAIGATLVDEGATTAGVILIGIAVVIGAATMAVQSALTQLFTLVLYREATEGAIVGPFPAGILRIALTRKEQKKPLRGRLREWFA